MKNRVNLYLEQLRPVKEVLPLKLSVSIWLVSIVVVVLVSGSLLWLKSQQQGANKVLATNLSMDQQVLAQRVRRREVCLAAANFGDFADELYQRVITCQHESIDQDTLAFAFVYFF